MTIFPMTRFYYKSKKMQFAEFEIAISDTTGIVWINLTNWNRKEVDFKLFPIHSFRVVKPVSRYQTMTQFVCNIKPVEEAEVFDCSPFSLESG